jgi:Rrf2 family protein
VKLEAKVECALRVMFELAHSSEETVAQADLARAANGDSQVLAETLAALTEAGLVESDDRERWRLAVDPSAICLADVVASCDTDGVTFQCPLGVSSCTTGRHCPTCWAFLEAELSATSVLERVTLAEIVERSTGQLENVSSLLRR